MSKEAKVRRRHSVEFKKEAVRQLETRGNRTVAEVAGDLGVPTNTWRHEYRAAKAERRVARGGETLEEEVQRRNRRLHNRRRQQWLVGGPLSTTSSCFSSGA